MEKKLNKIKVGIVGTGKFAEYHLSYWRSLKNTEIVGYYSYSNNNLDNLISYEHIDNLYENCTIIDIVTISNLNYKSLIKTFNYSHKTIFIEKPFCVNLGQLTNIEQKLKHTSNKYISSFFYKIVETYSSFLFRNYIKTKKILVKGYYKRDNNYLNKNNSWRLNYLSSGGGVLINQGIHLFDMIDQKYDLDIDKLKINKIISKNKIESFIDFTISNKKIIVNFKFSRDKFNKDFEIIELYDNFFSRFFITKNFNNHLLIFIFKYFFYFFKVKVLKKNKKKDPLYSFYNYNLLLTKEEANKAFNKKIIMMKKIFKIYELII